MRLPRAFCFLALVATAIALAGCTRAPLLPVLSEMDAARESADVREAERTAPQAYLHAEKLRKAALQASAGEDAAAAQILGEHAIVAYTHAAILARIARAEERLTHTTRELEHATSELGELDREQADLQAAADRIELELKVHRDAEPLAPNAPAAADREEARLQAAQALSLRARLLCVAARLLAREDTASSLVAELDRLDKALREKPLPVPIDEVMRLNTACLKTLSDVRRSGQKDKSTSVADALLTELSELGGLLPFRDDRGVVVTVREPGGPHPNLRPATERALETIGRVARSHPEFPLLVVVHAGRGAPEPQHRDVAEAVVAALKRHGAEKVALEVAGGRQPLVPWKRRGAAEQNARLEVVFVTP